MSDSLEIFTDAWTQLTHSPLWLILAVVTLCIGLTLKAVRPFPNRFIPLITLPFSTAAYALMGDRSQINPGQPYPVAMLAFYGFLLGFVTWGAHKFLLKKLEKFLPDGFFPMDDFDSAPPIPLPDGSNVRKDLPNPAEAPKVGL